MEPNNLAKQETDSFFTFLREAYFCPPKEPLPRLMRFLYALSGSFLSGVTILVAFNLAGGFAENAAREAKALHEANVLLEGKLEEAKEVLRKEKSLLETKTLQDVISLLKAKAREEEKKLEPARPEEDAVKLKEAIVLREAIRLLKTKVQEEPIVWDLPVVEFFIYVFVLILTLYFTWLVSWSTGKQGPLFLFVKGLVFTGFVLFIVQTILERMRAAL